MKNKIVRRGYRAQDVERTERLLDSLRLKGRGWYCNFSGRHDFGMCLPCGLEGLCGCGIATATRSMNVPASVGMERGYLFFYVKVRGITLLQVNGKNIRLSSGEFIAVSPDVPVNIRPLQNYFLPGTSAWLKLDVGLSDDKPWRWPDWIHLSEVIRKDIESAITKGGRLVYRMNEELLSRFRRLRTLSRMPDDGYRREYVAMLVNSLLVCFHEIICLKISEKEGKANVRVVNSILKVAGSLPQRLAEPFTIQSLADEAGLSVSVFIKTFVALTGETPRQCIIRLRLNEAKRLLMTTGDPVYKIAHKIGFTSESRLFVLFKSVFNQSPEAFREGRSF